MDYDDLKRFYELSGHRERDLEVRKVEALEAIALFLAELVEKKDG